MLPRQELLGREKQASQPGLGRAHTLLSEAGQPTYQASCGCQKLGGALELRRRQTDKRPGLLELAVLWEDRRGQLQWREKSTDRDTGLGHIHQAGTKEEATSRSKPQMKRSQLGRDPRVEHSRWSRQKRRLETRFRWKVSRVKAMTRMPNFIPKRPWLGMCSCHHQPNEEEAPMALEAQHKARSPGSQTKMVPVSDLGCQRHTPIWSGLS